MTGCFRHVPLLVKKFRYHTPYEKILPELFVSLALRKVFSSADSNLVMKKSFEDLNDPVLALIRISFYFFTLNKIIEPEFQENNFRRKGENHGVDG